MARYSLMRISIFFLTLIALWFAQLRGWPLLVSSALISAVISVYALKVPRERFAAQVERRVEKKRVKADAMRTAEDNDD
ncbi:DUF4229 domain-containing protein [Dermatophilaceae bacterium Sec6.4]